MLVVHRSYQIANRGWLWSTLVEGVVMFGWLVGFVQPYTALVQPYYFVFKTNRLLFPIHALDE